MTHACTTRRAYVLTEKYEKGVRTTARSWKRSSVVYLLIFVIMALLFTRLPGCFLPEEDQGMMIALVQGPPGGRSEEHTSELQSLLRISYAVLCLKKKNTTNPQ